MLGIIKQVGVLRFIAAGVAEVYRKVWRQFVCNSYSQNWEDVVIDRLLKFPQKGFYVEIGAYRPKRLSNTWRFYKKGLRGIVVEPNPNVIDKFKKYRPKDKFVSVGLGSRDGILKYYKFDIPALNTFSKKEADASQKKGYRISEILDVRVIGIKKFLTNYVGNNKIDILSIDTEGWDNLILKNWDWKYRPKIICVETNKKNSIEARLTKQDYTLVTRTESNSIFASK